MEHPDRPPPGRAASSRFTKEQTWPPRSGFYQEKLGITINYYDVARILVGFYRETRTSYHFLGLPDLPEAGVTLGGHRARSRTALTEACCIIPANPGCSATSPHQTPTSLSTSFELPGRSKNNKFQATSWKILIATLLHGEPSGTLARLF